MLKLSPDTRIFMAATPVDMRRSFSGLCAIIAETLGANPLGGDLFLFRGKRSDRVKAMIWDRTGLAIWYNISARQGQVAEPRCRGDRADRT